MGLFFRRRHWARQPRKEDVSYDLEHMLIGRGGMDGCRVAEFFRVWLLVAANQQQMVPEMIRLPGRDGFHSRPNWLFDYNCIESVRA